MNLKKPALLLLLPAFLCSAAEEKKENIPAIPVVKTYGDLLAAKPLLDVSLEEWKKAPPTKKERGRAG